MISTFQSTRPRGTRLRVQEVRVSPRGFNPRVRAGRDLLRGNAYALIGRFQSTRPRGTRLIEYRGIIEVIAGFNPRVRAGRDENAKPPAAIMLFQSTRPRGTRPELVLGVSRGVGKVSIHASARDATAVYAAVMMARMFQSTRPRGTRRSTRRQLTPACVSIHASARDATTSSRSASPSLSCFNPRVRAGRDLARWDQ